MSLLLMQVHLILKAINLTSFIGKAIFRSFERNDPPSQKEGLYY